MSRTPKTDTQTFAAVDLGSNSFHMIIARLHLGQLHIVDRMREQVRLAGGLDRDKRLDDDSQRRALQCLDRFGERLRGMPAAHVRAVGTSALRRARNSRSFLTKAHRTLGHPIEVIAGREEARLIYLGVAHDLSDDAGRRLVVDIGGGSTEFIIGERFEPLQADSLHMGCVSFSMRFFPGGKLRREGFRAAELAAAVELRSLKRRYRNVGWDSSVGSSGTINAIDAILRANRWSKRGVTAEGLQTLRKAMLAAGRTSRLALPGLEPERAAVLPGGLAILIAVFESLKLERMIAASGALREGLLYDIVGRYRHEDVRDRTVQSCSVRYGIDVEQAARVERSALALLKQALPTWKLDGEHEEQARQFLSWAARLHELGLAVTYSGYHKHGAYLLGHADMPGFSRDEQIALATLVRTHRRKVVPELFHAVPPEFAELVRRLMVLLRLAVLLNRSRNPRPQPAMQLVFKGSTVRLDFPEGWLEEHPMSHAELLAEAARLAAVGVKLVVR